VTGRVPAKEERAERAHAGPGRIVTLRIADAEHALPLEDVVEVVRMVAVAPVPDTPPWLLGAVDVRGELLPVIDVRQRLGCPRRDPTPGMVLVIAATPGGPIALCADGAGAVEVVSDDDARGAPVLRAGGRLVTLLDPAALGGDAHRRIGVT
jgi:chemotaxis signal transduction protein